MVALLPNSAEWALLFWACLKAGITFIPIDPRSVDYLDELLKDVPHPTYIVVQDAGTAARVDTRMCSKLANSILIQCSSVNRNGWITFWDRLDEYEKSLDGSILASSTASPPQASAPALVIFTSGTSRSPKGCPHTVRNLVAQSHNFDPNPDPLSQDRWLVHTPMSHMVGINNAIRAWRTGGTVVFPSEFFCPNATTSALTDDLCTVMSVNSTLIKALKSTSYPKPERLALDYVSLGGDRFNHRDIEACFEDLHAKVAIGAYGLSEGAPLMSEWIDDASGRIGCRYKVLPGVMARMCRPGSRDVLPRRCSGELHVGGPSVITSYLGGADPESFYVDKRGNWLITGDWAYMDELGLITITDRTKDMIKRGGHSVSPTSVEMYLRKYFSNVSHRAIPRLYPS
jgi:acyl-CoA synthetase (AMP-forming)/AMP-acid ligase II